MYNPNKSNVIVITDNKRSGMTLAAYAIAFDMAKELKKRGVKSEVFITTPHWDLYNTLKKF